MLRVARPLTTALLWLAIALLPMRGWAAAVMPAAAGIPAAAAAAMALDHAQASMATPCHAANDAAPAEHGTDATHTCSLCDLCHASAATAPVAQVPSAPWPASAPRSEPPQPIERAVLDSPERPPRH